MIDLVPRGVVAVAMLVSLAACSGPSVAAIEESNFTLDEEPPDCPEGSGAQCRLSSTHDGLRLWVYAGSDRHDELEPADGEVIVELQLSPTT